MACPITKRTTQQPGSRTATAPQKGVKTAPAKPVSRKAKVTRKQLEEACEKLGVLTHREVRIRMADLKGYERPFSRQAVYNLINSHELKPAIPLAGMATVTKASWDAYVVRYENGLSK